MKRAVLVLGAESSGTRLMTEILVRLGYEGDYGHEQRWDAGIPDNVERLVWRRSYPHAGKIPNIDYLLKQLWACDFRISIIVTCRDWHASALSQVKAGHVQDYKQAIQHIGATYKNIFHFLGETNWNPYVLVNYEAIIQNGWDYLVKILSLAHIHINQESVNMIKSQIKFINGNEKYYSNTE